MILVNGSEGIGTGWSTSIPCFNPRDIVANLLRMLSDEEPIQMHPWYRGYKVFGDLRVPYLIKLIGND